VGRGNHLQGSILDAANALNALLEIFQLERFSSDQNGFQAMVVVKMLVLRPQDLGFGIVLRMEELVHEVGFMMVIDDAQDPDNSVMSFDISMNGLGTNHRAKRIGTIGIEPLSDLIIHQL